MRFVLDNNVDARARRLLLTAGHDCWTIEQAGLGDAPDDDVAVYAWDQLAIPVINDRAFAERLRSRDLLGGNVLYGKCRDTRFVELLEIHIAEAVRLLSKAPKRTERIVRFDDAAAIIWHPEYLA